MAKEKYWVLENVEKVVKGTYKMADNNHKSNYIEAVDGTIYSINGAIYGYASIEEAAAAFNEDLSRSKKTSTAKNISENLNRISSPNFTEGKYIGSDEVGKIEPLKQLIVTAVHVKADKFDTIKNDLKVDDSKKIPSRIEEIGKELTKFEDFSQIKSGTVYKNEEYGLTFCTIILSNEEYNEYKNIKINVNEVLTLIHNNANLKLLNDLNEQNVNITDIIIDDYMGERGDTKFKEYLDGFENKEINIEKITEATNVKLSFEKQADSKYKVIVGSSSVICAYVDKLWQKHLNAKYNMDLDYGNDISSKNLNDSFEKIMEINYGKNINELKNSFNKEELFNKIDEYMPNVKHTKTYTEWKSEFVK